MINFSFYCFGHHNILAKHKSTIEITKEHNLTLKGDCIIGVNSTHGLADLPTSLKNAIRKKDSSIAVILEVNGMQEIIKGKGDPNLILTDNTDIVIRKSSYICPRTLMINANKSAKDLSREFVRTIRDPNTKIKVTITVF